MDTLTAFASRIRSKDLLVALVAVMLSIAVALSPAGADSAFDDVASDHDAAASFNLLADLQIFLGYGDGTVGPFDLLTREQFAVVVIRMLGVEDSAEALAGHTPPFVDGADVSSWARGHIQLAADMDILSGYPDGTVGPQIDVTFAEAFAMLARATELDDASVGDWPDNYLNLASQIGLTLDLDVEPNEPINRSDMAIASHNALHVEYRWDGQQLVADVEPLISSVHGLEAQPRGPPEDVEAVPIGDLEVHFINVGQGDATLLKGPDFSVLIDAGRHTGSEVVPYLQSVGVLSLDLMILTHPHADHIGEADHVLQTLPVDEVWMSGWEHTTLTFERVIDAILASDAGYHEPRAGETFSVGSLGLEVVHPAQPLTDIHDNIAVRVVYGGFAALFTGDAEAVHESQMVQRGENLAVDVLQLGHHGSSTSTSSLFLDVVSPDVAIYSAGAGNQFGHPHDEVVSRVLDRGINLYGTNVHGTIIVTTDGSTYTISTQTDGEVSAPTEGCVDLNTADFERLQDIIHIGPVRAQDIINMRPWSSVSEMSNISGIGPARLADIEEQGLACVE